jgi:hypothetical protein
MPKSFEEPSRSFYLKVGPFGLTQVEVNGIDGVAIQTADPRIIRFFRPEFRQLPIGCQIGGEVCIGVRLESNIPFGRVLPRHILNEPLLAKHPRLLDDHDSFAGFIDHLVSVLEALPESVNALSEAINSGPNWITRSLDSMGGRGAAFKHVVNEAVARD